MNDGGRMSMSTTPEERIAAALDMAMQYGQIDGNHHKMWVIDQMVRLLTDCPTVQRTVTNARGSYTFDALGESAAYERFIAEHADGDDGPSTYEWDTGTAP
jgi:hypothetical protein